MTAIIVLQYWPTGTHRRSRERIEGEADYVPAVEPEADVHFFLIPQRSRQN
jgi:hypothetical protein